jgi:high-affinity Fe2+/Pb2+ permease
MDDEILLKLQTALDLVGGLKNENEELKMDLKRLQQKNIAVETEHRNSEMELLLRDKEKIIAIEAADKTKLFWKTKYDQKEAEVDILKQMKPGQQEFDRIRFEINSEVEKKELAKHNLLTKECEKFMGLYYKIRRELESSKAESDQIISSLERSVKESKRLHDEDLQIWQNKIVNLQLSMGLRLLIIDQTSDLERLRISQREKSELELRVSHLLVELDELSSKKEQLKIDSELADRNNKRLISDLIAESKVFLNEKQSFKVKCETLEEETRISLRTVDEVQDENNKLKRELDKTLNTLEEKSHKSK